MPTFKQTELLKDAGADEPGDQHSAHDRMMIILEGDFTGGVTVNIETRLDEERVWQVARGADGSLASFILPQPNFNLVGITRGSQLRAVTVGGDVSTKVTVIAVESEFSDGTMFGIASLASAVNPLGGLDVNIQDQTTRPLFLPFSKELGPVTILTVEPVAGVTKTLTVADSAGWAGQGIGVFSGDGSGKFFFGTVVSTPTSTTMVIDSPIDYAFTIATTVLVQLTYEMAVDGSSTPQVFAVRGADAFEYDITRILISYITDNAVDFNGFGDSGTSLTNGVAMRRVNGEIQNFFNVKRNIGWANVAYDLTRYVKVNPQDVDAMAVRLTFAGQSKIGVALRLLNASDMLESLIQDNLLPAGPYGIESMSMVAEGHVVD